MHPDPAPRSNPQPVVGRFAPSPTGPLHLGSLVTALGSFLLARSAGGRWLLRVEDLDQPRVVPGAADDIRRTLERLGLCWDGEVTWQTRRLDAYGEALALLVGQGLAYPCGCSRAEILRSASAPHPGEEGTAYPGTCRKGLPAGKSVRAYRARTGSHPIAFRDGVQGEFAAHLAQAGGDFVVKRADGPFAYQLAVVVDDAAAGITQVARGSDLLASTPRQIHLQRLLKLPTPTYWHLPLVVAPDGSKLSKRDCAVSLSAGRDLGREGGGLLLAALRFLGQAPPDALAGAPPAEVLRWAIDDFDPRRIPRGPAPFPRLDPPSPLRVERPG